MKLILLSVSITSQKAKVPGKTRILRKGGEIVKEIDLEIDITS
jgi:hypothetical protein